jgi:hypothetical protein
MEEQTIRFEQLNETHIEAFQRLIYQVYKKNVSAETIRNKYISFVDDKEWIAILAFAGDEPVAFAGNIITPMIYKGQRVLSGHLVDSMTSPTFMAKGLYTSVVNKNIELLQKRGVQFVWGFANQNSEAAATKKLNFVFQHRFIAFGFDKGESFLSKVRTKINYQAAQKRTMRILNRFEQTEAFKGSLVSNEELVTIDKTPAYMQYKFKGGSKVYLIDGVKFWINVKTHLLIGDIEYEEKAQLEKAIKTFLDLVIKHQLGKVYFHAIEPSGIGEVLKSFGATTVNSWSLCYRNLSCDFPLEQFVVAFGDIDTF